MQPDTSRPPQESRPWWLSFLAGIGLFNLLGMVLFFVVLLSLTGSGSDGWKSFRSAAEKKDAVEVGVVEVMDEITDSKKMIRDLYRLRDNEDIRAIVVRIDSPGGSASHSEEMHNALLEVRKQKPVVVSMGQLAASGGYYIAAAGQKIYAQPTTITGSIGVIAISTQIDELLAWAKMKPNVYKTGAHKDTLSPLRAPTPEDETLIRGMLSSIYDEFLADVLAGRPNADPEKIKAVADGRVLTGRQAKELGLIDEFGGLRDAAREAATLAGADLAEDPKLVYPKRDTEEMLERFLANTISGAGARVINSAKPRSGVMLWWPGLDSNQER